MLEKETVKKTETIPYDKWVAIREKMQDEHVGLKTRIKMLAELSKKVFPTTAS
jgi:hypothetical protein